MQHVEKISAKSYQILVKSALAQYYRSELSEILETVKIIEKKQDKFQALKMLIPHLPWNLMQLSKILEITKEISDQDRVKLLSMLPQHFPKSEKLLEEVFVISQHFDSYKRGDVLIGLAPYLSNKLLKQALNRALDDENEESQALCLIPLTTAPCLNEYLEEKIREKAESYKNPYSQTLVLNALLTSLTDQLDKVQLEAQLDKILQNVQTFKDENDKANILSKLASRLSLSQLEQILDRILQKVQAFENEYNKAKVLSELGSRLSSDQLEEVQQLLQRFEDENCKVSVLEGIVNNPNLISDVIQKIQKQSENFDNKDNRVQVLSALIMHLPEKERETYFPTDLLVRILEEAQTIEDNDDNNYQTNSIRYLLAQLPQQVGGFEETKILDIEYYKDLAKREMISCLPSDELDKILKEVENLEHERDKVLALSGIAVTPNLTKKLIKKIQQQAEKFDDKGSRIQVLSYLAGYLSKNQIDEILREVLELEDISKKNDAFRVLASHLPLVQIDKILQKVQTLVGGEKWKVNALSKLAFRLSSLSSDKPHNRLYKNHKEQVVITLAPFFKSDQLNEILQNIQVSKKDHFTALALSAIIPHLASDQTQEALKVTQAIEDRLERADILRVLTLELAKFPCDQLHPLWGEMLHILASRDRRNLLSDFRELTPVISKLGTDEAIVELCHVIKDIGRQFP